MNRIVLIGNGFDKAHGLQTGYEDFINWYWDTRVRGFLGNRTNSSADCLCVFECHPQDSWNSYYYNNVSYFNKQTGKEIIESILKEQDKYIVTFSPFFERISKSIETKGWVDIENEYYELLIQYSLKEDDEAKVKDLNKQLHFLQDKLVEYLTEVNRIEVKPIKSIESAIYSIIYPQDVSIGSTNALKDHIEAGMALSDEYWKVKLVQYGCSDSSEAINRIHEYRDKHVGIPLWINKSIRCLKNSMGYKENTIKDFLDMASCPISLYLPNNIMLLNFNYTNTADLYCRPKEILRIYNLTPINHIHGEVSRPESVIFGYGDEMDEKYKELVKKNDNNCLSNIKSIKYLESDNYRKVLSFIESEPYQILIMGHSCGNSDRTLLNTLFEHRNCVSIKPYYYINDKGKDNYIDIVQNISRNFNDMKLMRDRVVNKLYCEPLTKKDSQESDQ